MISCVRSVFVFGVFNVHGDIFHSIISVEVISLVLRYPFGLVQNDAGNLKFLLRWFVNLSAKVLLCMLGYLVLMLFLSRILS